MAYPLLVLIDLVGILLIDLLLLATVQIQQDVPATIMPGSEVRVTVNVEKGDLTGFAKLQLDLPPGLTCSAIETKGASFTFADQKAKFIWMSLPSQPSFRVSYTLIADANAQGSLQITGRLSYIEDNERRTYDLPSSTVTVMGEPQVAATVTSPKVDPEIDASNDLVSAAGAAPVDKATVPVITRASEAAAVDQNGVTATRVVKAVTETEMLVEITLQKGTLRGFGKIQETIPAGFTAMEKTSAQAIFTTQDRIVKLVWLNLPATTEVKVVYKLRANDQPFGQYSVSGEFGYLLNDETQRTSLGTTQFYTGPKALEAIAAQEDKMGEQATEDGSAIATKTEPAKKKEVEPKAEESKPTQPAATRIPSPEKGINYKVQITAAHREVGKEYFAQRHRFNNTFSVERHEGWIKYTTGSFLEYREARDKRVELVDAGHKFPGPFVTAYNDGARITVQEALMISNQKWFQ